MNNKIPTLLLDGDMILYRASAANEVEVNWGDDLWTLHSDAKEAWVMLDDQVQKICKELQSNRFVFCLSDDQNFRKEVYPDYKSKRKETRKPLAYYALKQWVMDNYEYAIFPKCEADDVMGILATQKDANCIIVSEDKDMMTVPARLYRQGELRKIDEATADYHVFFQTLTGDATDGYPGCKGFGAVKAEKVLKAANPMEYWKIVVDAFKASGETEDGALSQARCARILRSSDFDLEKKTIVLWNPQ